MFLLPQVGAAYLRIDPPGSPDARRKLCLQKASDDAAHKAAYRRSIPGGHTKRRMKSVFFVCRWLEPDESLR